MLLRSQSAVQQFEIQLEGNTGRNDDIILLSGPPLGASASHFYGQLVLTTLDYSHVKRVTIKLVGTIRLRWGDSSTPRFGPLPVKYEKQLYSQEFSDFEIPGRIVNSNPGSQRATPVSSLTNLSSYFGGHKHKSSLHLSSAGNFASSANFSPAGGSSLNPSPRMSRQDSTTSLINLAGPHIGNSMSSMHTSPPGTSSQSHQVPPGVHKFGFDFVIPGDINESIEGNRYSQLAYWLVATVERGRMQHKLTAKKHIRIVRTVGIDSYDIAHTVSIENVWPKKIEYKIEIPCRAVAVGSQLQVHFNMQPVDKGLKLGKIRAEIVEYVTLSTPLIPQREEEHVIAQQFLEPPPNFDHFQDDWELVHMVDVPQSLSRCTQDVIIQPYTKISHKCRCFISLINADGHTSELRASLPITIYISPNIYIVGSNEEENPVQSSKSKTPAAHVDEQPIFNVERTARSGQVIPTGVGGDNAAPPTYSHHVFDRLFSTVATPVESPSQSGAATPPMSAERDGMGQDSTLANLDASQQAQLAANLRQLAMSRQNSYQNMPQLNRRGSSAIDVMALSRVPSYDQAINEQASADAAPDYS